MMKSKLRVLVRVRKRGHLAPMKKGFVWPFGPFGFQSEENDERERGSNK